MWRSSPRSKAVEGIELLEGVQWLRAHAAEEYVEQIGRLMENPSMKHTLTSAGRELVRTRYTVEALEEPLHQLLRLLIT